MRVPLALFRAWFVRFGIALVIASVLTTGGVLAVNLGIDAQFRRLTQKDLAVADEPPEADAGNFLLIGSDTRSFVKDSKDAERFGTEADTGPQRSDTIMLAHVDPELKQIYLVSFPRDLWVNIPGVGKDRINAAYNHGPQKIIDTITTNFGVPIHHYLEVDFSSFRGVVDALGGVKIYFPAPARDKKTGLKAAGFGAGCYNLGGDNALAYVRSRAYQEFVNKRWRSDPTGDIGRIERQKGFMRALAAESARQAAGSFRKARQISEEVLKSDLVADDALSRGDVLGLIGAFLDLDPSDPRQLVAETFPWDNGPRQSGKSVLYPKTSELAPVLARLRTFGPPAADTAKPTLMNSAVRVRVLNGTTKVGFAASTLAALQQQGFAPAGTGDAPRQEGGVTEVRYRPGAEEEAKLVKSYLGGTGVLMPDTSIHAADVAVVLRYDFVRVSAATTAPPTAPPPTATTRKAATTTTTAKPAPATPAPAVQSATC